ncbi:MAG TPA: hypothetical protein VE956_17665 [Nodularia sp. (in: cyanobacteria)]|nr:hypothetical protein [Nodularia sp. (in: cyanobacteria)]
MSKKIDAMFFHLTTAEDAFVVNRSLQLAASQGEFLAATEVNSFRFGLSEEVG